MDLANGEWRTLPPAEQLAVRNTLALKLAETGRASPKALPDPGSLALKHDANRTVQRPHLELIDAAVRPALTVPNYKLMIFTPPQVGKSSRVSRWLPFWWLTHRPRHRILLASYGERLAVTHGREARNYVRAFGAEYGLFLDEEESSASDWSTLSGGGMRSRGIRGGLTGMAANLGLIDDPIADRAAADSVTIRDATWEWYSGTFMSRLSPDAPQILTMTRWHPRDLAGQLLEREGRIEEGGEWTVLHLPAIAVEPDPEKGFYPDPLGRAVGEPLTHPTIDTGDTEALMRHWNAKRKASVARDWGALYQGSPFNTEGGLLDQNELNERTGDWTIRQQRRAGVGVDPSGGGRDTAGIVGGIVDTSGRFWWTHDRSGVMSSDLWALAACRLAAELDAEVIVFESNFGGDQSGLLIRQAWDQLQRMGEIPETKNCPLIKAVHSKKGKWLRAEPIAQSIKVARAWFGPGLLQLKQEWMLWEPGSSWSPGALDAAVHLATHIMPPVQGSARIGNPAGKRRDAIAASPFAARRRG